MKQKIIRFKNSLFFTAISLIAGFLIFIAGIIGGVSDFFGIIDREQLPKINIDSLLEPRTFG